MPGDRLVGELTLPEQAARWIIELEEGNVRELSELTAWLKVSPAHVEEFLLAMSTWRAFDALDPHKRAELERILAAL